MGFFSKALGFLGAAAGGIAGFLVGGPAGALAGASIGAGIGMSSSQASEQADALERAGKAQEAIQMRQLALYQKLLDEGKPVREAQNAAQLELIPGFKEAALEGLSTLREGISRPGLLPSTTRAISKGTKRLASEFSQFGLLDSSAFGVAAGELTGGLTARDEDIRRSTALSLAGLAPRPAVDLTGLAPGVLAGAGATGRTIGGLEVAGAGGAGLFGDIGETLIKLPSMFRNLGSGGGGLTPFSPELSEFVDFG